MRICSLLAALPLLAAGSSFACDADTRAYPLFSCETENAGQFITICGVEHGPDEKWTDIQYQYGGEKPSFVYPDNPADGGRSLFFSHVSKAGAYIVTVRFVSEGVTYRVYSKAVSEMEGEAGVVIDNTSRPSMNKIACIERPYMFPEYLRRSLACDMENPLGVRACEENPPDVP